MKAKLLIGSVLAFFAGTFIATAATQSTATGLIRRVLPRQAESFVVEEIRPENGQDVFEIESRGDKIVLRGNNGVVQASAFNWYLKHIAGGGISTHGDQLVLPNPLPKLAQKIRNVSSYALRGQMNYCTFCYTAAFWGWAEWEREIDRMAMNGVNAPLMIVGNEKTWQNVLRRLGYKDADIAKFIPSSAFTAWWLMGNLEGEGGPVSQKMIDREAELARKILARMGEYGMKPIQQGFCGVVPTTFSSYFPSANVIPQGQWAGGYVRPSVLSPLDPMFAKVADIWFSEQAKLYGKSHYYGGDLFHEGGDSHGLNLGECAKAIEAAQQRHAPGSVWVLQGWGSNPPPALVAATNPENVLVQHLSSYPESISLGGFQNRPWVFATANNFGGHESFGGNLKVMATLPSEALQKPNQNLVGLAILDEALDTHPAFTDMFADTIWAKQNIDLAAWLDAYPKYRYGKADKDASAAWQIIGGKVMALRPRENLLCARPSVDIRSTSSWGECISKQNPLDMIDASNLLLKASKDLRRSSTYRHDCVDAVRQVMQDYGFYLYHAMMSDYKAGQRDAFRANLKQFRELLTDMDTLLASGEYSMLGTWIERARNKGETREESDQYEQWARQLITLWTPKQTNLSDYAYRNWSGLYHDYYIPRWENFLSKLDKSLDDSKIQPIYDAQAAEVAWVANRNKYPTKPTGDAYLYATTCLAKYGERSRKLVTHWETEVNRWKWTLASSADKTQTLSWDISDILRAGGAGTYQLRVDWQTGSHAIITHGALLEKTVAMAVNGDKIAEDLHAGRSGLVSKDNVYLLNVGNVAADAKYFLRIKVEGDNGNDSHGRIQFEKTKPKP